MTHLITNAGFIGHLIIAFSVLFLALSITTILLTKSRRVALYFCRLSPLPLVAGLVAHFYSGQMSQINAIEFYSEGMDETQIHQIETKEQEQGKAALYIGLAGTLVLLSVSGFLAIKTKTPKKPLRSNDSF